MQSAPSTPKAKRSFSDLISSQAAKDLQRTSEKRRSGTKADSVFIDVHSNGTKIWLGADTKTLDRHAALYNASSLFGLEPWNLYGCNSATKFAQAPLLDVYGEKAHDADGKLRFRYEVSVKHAVEFYGGDMLAALEEIQATVLRWNDKAAEADFTILGRVSLRLRPESMPGSLPRRLKFELNFGLRDNGDLYFWGGDAGETALVKFKDARLHWRHFESVGWERVTDSADDYDITAEIGVKNVFVLTAKHITLATKEPNKYDGNVVKALNGIEQGILSATGKNGNFKFILPSMCVWKYYSLSGSPGAWEVEEMEYSAPERGVFRG